MLRNFKMSWGCLPERCSGEMVGVSPAQGVEDRSGRPQREGQVLRRFFPCMIRGTPSMLALAQSRECGRVKDCRGNCSKFGGVEERRPTGDQRTGTRTQAASQRIPHGRMLSRLGGMWLA